MPLGQVLALLAAAGWGAFGVALRKGQERLDPGAGFLIALALGALFNLVLFGVRLAGGGPLAPLAAGGGLLTAAGAPAPARYAVALIWFCLAGIAITLVGRWFYFSALLLIGPSRTSAWSNSAPVVTVLLGAAFLAEPVTLPALAGVAVAVAGLVVLSRERAGGGGVPGPQDADAPRRAQAGVLSGMGAAVCFALGVIARKAGLQIWPEPLLGNSIGPLVALATYACTPGARAAWPLARTAGAAAGFFLLAALFSSLGQTLGFLALRYASAATVHVYNSLEPIFTLIFSALVLGRHELITRRLLVSVALVTAGIAIMGVGRG